MKKMRSFVMGLAAVFVLNGAALGEEPAVALPASAKDVCPLLVGEKVPAVGLETAAGEVVQLQDLVDGKPTILIFYRGGW